jgi:hypothetical protein
MRTLLALSLCTLLAAGPALASKAELARGQASAKAGQPPATTIDTGHEPLNSPAQRLPKAPRNASRETETWVVGNTLVDYQSNGATQMIAVSSDGVVHGAFMGGSGGNDRRVKAWCVDDGQITGPLNAIDERSGYVTADVTGPDPQNGLEPNSTALGYHSNAGPWFGIDFDGCTMAFNNVVPNFPSADIIWPHVAVDAEGGIHLVAYNSTNSDIWYSYSPDAMDHPLPALQLTDEGRSLGSMPITSKSGSRAAVLFHQRTDAEDIPFDMGEGFIGIQIHADILAFVAPTGEDLHGVIDESTVHNLTDFGPNSTAPFGKMGSRGYCDVEGIFDFTAEENLHMAYTGGPQWTDTLHVWWDPAIDDTLHMVYMHWDLGKGMIWHHNVDTGSWSHIWGSNSSLTEAEAERFQKGAWRQRQDRPSFAIDPETGYLYCAWTQLSNDDRAEPAPHGCTSPITYGMPNADIYISCSADNGETWGLPVNITDTQTPDCLPGDCLSEDWSSMAELVHDGYLHLTYILDQDPGGVPQCEGTEMIVDVEVMRVPVADIPPHDGTPWNAAGRVGLAEVVRWYGWFAAAWCGEEAVFDSVKWIDPVTVMNESPMPVQLDRISFHHSILDQVGPPEEMNLTELGCEVLVDGSYIPVEEWNGLLPTWTAVKFRSHMAYSGLTNYDVLLGFHFPEESGHPSLYYRMEMENALQDEGEEPCTGVNRIEVDQIGNFEETVLVTFEVGVEPALQPLDFELWPPYPNPFNPTTTLEYRLERGTRVELAVFNLAGQLVTTLESGYRGAGFHRAVFEAEGLASGVYFARLTAGGQVQTQKLVLAR